MRRFYVVAAVAAGAWGCYSMRSGAGGGQASFRPPRQARAADVAAAPGYSVEAVATGLNFPSGVAFDDRARPYVVEAGYSYGEVWTTPRLVRIEPDGRHETIVATKDKNGPWTGVAFHQGAFFIAEGGQLEGGRILRVTPQGEVTAIVQGLPSFGDHHTNGPAVGPDGWLYFGQGSATNSGVVGEDDARFGWLKRKPEFHDIPCEDITLSGANFPPKNPSTGAFSRFGTTTTRGQRVPGELPCTGAVLRVRPEGGALQLVAWGFRNPSGLAFSPMGQLYVTDNGYDDRGSRPVWGMADLLWKVEPGTWYGWPDFSGSLPLDGLKPPGRPKLGFLLAKHPNKPPRPAAKLAVHSSSNGIDFSRNAAFGHVGEAFVAQFGDTAPGPGKLLHPVGFKVLRVDVATGRVAEFLVNKGRRNGPASRIGAAGLERPLALRFDPAGLALYVVDFGVMTASERGPTPHERTGVLWRIRRAEP